MKITEQAKLWEKNLDRKAAKIRADRVLKLIKKYNPKTKKILELGVGLGAVLVHFSPKYEVSGLDFQNEYIKIAKKLIPKAKFYTQGMDKLKINEKFDTIFSVHECINEVKPYKNWELTFKKVFEHLNQEGLWIFDMRTQKHLEEKKKQVVELEKTPTGYIYDGFEVKGNKLFWKTIYFKKVKGNLYEIEHDNYFEEIYNIQKVEKSLLKHFKILDKIPIKEGLTFMFVCQKK
jgi:cyclopropane fatty-acyl-phospholipid synthase-like methyltransferase